MPEGSVTEDLLTPIPNPLAMPMWGLIIGSFSRSR